MWLPKKLVPQPRKTEVVIPPLAATLEQVPDWRSAQGRRHPLAAMLKLACVALLCGYQTPYAIAEWVANYGVRYLARFGFTRSQPPGQATWYRVLGGIDRVALERTLAQWAQRVFQALRTAEKITLPGVSIDGKTLRGSQQQGAADSHLLAAVAQELGVVLGQVAVADKTNEIGAVAELLSLLVLEGCVVTTDALLTQTKVAQQVLDAGGEYILIAKKNQPTLYEDIKLLFAAPPPRPRGETWPAARSANKGHGRLEVRALQASTQLNAYLQWPGVQQVFRLERTRQVTTQGQTQTTTKVVYGITSLSPAEAPAAQLLTYTRAQWHIENKVHWVRDVTFGEDLAQVRRQQLPHVMAALRNAVLSVLRAVGVTNIARARRHFAAQPEHALTLIGVAA